MLPSGAATGGRCMGEFPRLVGPSHSAGDPAPELSNNTRGARADASSHARSPSECPLSHTRGN
eukprot:12916460-Prorocentrum_lima.AAC.1